MIESLYDLNQQIKDLNKKACLWITYDNILDVVKKIIKSIDVDAIYVNEDYTPYAIERDASIKKFCQQHSINFHAFTDCLLLDTQDIAANNGNRYYNFTLFYKKTLQIKIRKPQTQITNNFKNSNKII